MSTRTLRPIPSRPWRRASRGRGTGGAPPGSRRLGQILVEAGHLKPDELIRAVYSLSREETRLGDVLLAHGMVEEATLYATLAQQFGTSLADLAAEPPDARLIDRLGIEACLQDGLLPWKRVGGATLIATARPERFADAQHKLEAAYGRVAMVITTETGLHAALMQSHKGQLVQKAETRVRASESCRHWRRSGALGLSITALALVSLVITLPGATLALLSLWAVATLVALTTLKASAALLQARAATRNLAPPAPGANDPVIARLPIVSILVPLYKEREIADHLIKRLARLTYPKELLDICLVVEADDTVTLETLKTVALPVWIRQIIVPEGTVKTKPRALNYALDFCRGSIVGVYDAEDAPAPDQITQVVRRFHQRGSDVACLQGVLDFYNARTNWLSRCFAIEYAAWFRVVLPGFVKLGLVIPLGGTTLFFRREALERLGGWDAHNVTEDADLGLRLARYGYRTELVETVTAEEANARVWPWIKQRSRWLKGYAMTWAVHSRRPLALWRDLGTWKFIGVQLLFLGTLTQFLLAPLLWSFWLLLFGFDHPVAAWLSPEATIALVALFLLSELVNIGVGVLAVSGPAHRHLVGWVPTLHLYFPLAAIACYKGVAEMLTRPFYWDKTAHGVFAEDPVLEPEPADAAAIRPPQSRPRPASAASRTPG